MSKINVIHYLDKRSDPRSLEEIADSDGRYRYAENNHKLYPLNVRVTFLRKNFYGKSRLDLLRKKMPVYMAENVFEFANEVKSTNELAYYFKLEKQIITNMISLFDGNAENFTFSRYDEVFRLASKDCHDVIFDSYKDNLKMQMNDYWKGLLENYSDLEIEELLVNESENEVKSRRADSVPKFMDFTSLFNWTLPFDELTKYLFINYRNELRIKRNDGEKLGIDFLNDFRPFLRDSLRYRYCFKDVNKYGEKGIVRFVNWTDEEAELYRKFLMSQTYANRDSSNIDSQMRRFNDKIRWHKENIVQKLTN